MMLEQCQKLTFLLKGSFCTLKLILGDTWEYNIIAYIKQLWNSLQVILFIFCKQLHFYFFFLLRTLHG